MDKKSLLIDLITELIFFFISRAEPDLEFEGLLKRRHTQIKYLSGSLMNPGDLERAQVSLEYTQI